MQPTTNYWLSLSIFCTHILIEYQSYAGGLLVNCHVSDILVNCEWFLSQLSVKCWAWVGRLPYKRLGMFIVKFELNKLIWVWIYIMSEVLCFFRPIVNQYSVNYWRSISEVLVRYQWSICEVLVKYRWTESYVGRHKISTDITNNYWPSLGQLLANYWPTFAWHFNSLSTDISPDCQAIYQSRQSTVNTTQNGYSVSVDKQKHCII